MLYDSLRYFALFLLLISGSAFGAALFDKRFHATLLPTLLGITVFLYIGGLLGVLAVFARAAVYICFALLALALGALIVKKRWRAFLSAFFTPAFWIFAVVFFVSCFMSRGMRPYTWDEFSHWADCVKAMYSINDFCTNPAAFSQYRAYPPAMALFQYFIIVTRDLFSSAPRFDEGLLYTAYQVFYCALFIPFLGGLRLKAWPVALLAGAAAFTLPAVYYKTYYECIYIDCFLGLMGGFTFAFIYLGKWRKPLGLATIMMAECVLVLSKDSGMLFAAMSAAYAICDALVIKRRAMKENTAKEIPALLAALLVCLSVAAAKLSWNAELHSNGIAATSMQIDLPGFFRLITGKDAGNYRADIIPAYLRALFLNPQPLKNIGLNAALLLIALAVLPRADGSQAHGRARKTLLVCFAGALAVIYLTGLLMLYLYRFGEYEGTRLASFNRYACTLLAALLLLATAAAMRALRGAHPFKTKGAGVICIAMALVFTMLPLPSAVSTLYGQSKASARGNTQLYVNTADHTRETLLAFDPAGRARVQVIAQENTGYMYWAQRYYLRGFGRVVMHRGFNFFSIGTPFYDGDIWTMKLTPDEWADILRDEIDFVLPLHLNDYFIEHFSPLFENSAVETGRLYRVTQTAAGGILLVEAK